MQDENAVGITANSGNFNAVTISNGVFNHLNILNIISTGTNEFSTTIPSWDDNTVMNATFNGTIDAGSLSEIVANIARIEVQRQEVGQNEWLTLKTIYKEPGEDTIQANFTMYDTLNCSSTAYYYQLTPYDISNNPGTAIKKYIISQFDDAFIADSNRTYNITKDYELSKQREQITTEYRPYGSKYPFVALNAATNYDSGSLTAILTAPTSESGISSYIDRKAQKRLEDEFNSWLTNGRAKILKDFNGEIKIIFVTNAVSNDYYKELGNGLASTSFNFVEICGLTQEELDKYGITQKFDLHINNE